MPTLDLTGLDRLTERFRRLINPDATPLMVNWMKTIDDDNRLGVMAGLDKDGNPMAPVRYRPVGKPVRPSRRRGQFQGFGATAYGNLTSAEYRRLAGPPLAPRGIASRVITNLRLRYGRLGLTQWEAVGYWDEVLSRQGRPFLMYHFLGSGRLPRRDLAGMRPGGVEKARKAARAWMISEIRANG